MPARQLGAVLSMALLGKVEVQTCTVRATEAAAPLAATHSSGNMLLTLGATHCIENMLLSQTVLLAVSVDATH